MTTTSDERREVAERLRFCARDINGTRDFSMYLGHWVNADEEQGGNPFTVQADRKSAERTLEKLADLIDPTCAVADYGHPDWHTVCRGCLSCHGVWYEDVYDMPYTHCPRCGARVTSEGER